LQVIAVGDEVELSIKAGDMVGAGPPAAHSQPCTATLLHSNVAGINVQARLYAGADPGQPLM
jgi:hypothetical protein